MVRASAPGKCILFGEHAVVYGEPAVAVAIDARVEVSISPCKGEWKVDGNPLIPERHPHIVSLRDAVAGEDAPPHSLMVQSDLFPAAGLGSSAALSAATCAGLLQVFGEELDSERIATLAHLAEAAAQQGRASPVDTSTATLGGCVLLSNQKEELADWRFTRNLTTPDGELSWEIHSVELPERAREAWLVVGSTGIHSPTGKMVSGVAELLDRRGELREVISKMGVVARAGVSALSAGNLEEVGELMDLAHSLLQEIEVSRPELDRLVEVARPTSLGAKMTGAGGGGCMIALTLNPKATAEAIEMRGGRVIITPLGAPGVRTEESL
jgi:mevalonate kinase